MYQARKRDKLNQSVQMPGIQSAENDRNASDAVPYGIIGNVNLNNNLQWHNKQIQQKWDQLKSPNQSRTLKPPTKSLAAILSKQGISGACHSPLDHEPPKLQGIIHRKNGLRTVNMSPTTLSQTSLNVDFENDRVTYLPPTIERIQFFNPTDTNEVINKVNRNQIKIKREMTTVDEE